MREALFEVGYTALMENPWLNISLNDYESHMAYKDVMQLQALNGVMKSQFADYPFARIAVLGVAGGNGLEWVDISQTERVFGVDINSDYLALCKERHPELAGILQVEQIDICQDYSMLPNVDLIIADLFIEYVGIDVFCKAILTSEPQIVSCVLQSHEKSSGIASTSPYMSAFDGLDSIVVDIDEDGLSASLARCGYTVIKRDCLQLANGKVFTRLDFRRA